MVTTVIAFEDFKVLLNLKNFIKNQELLVCYHNSPTSISTHACMYAPSLVLTVCTANNIIVNKCPIVTGCSHARLPATGVCSH